MNVLCCDCAQADLLPHDVKRAVRDGLRARGIPHAVVPDLCELAARRDPRLIVLAEAGELRIAACYPRAVTGLLRMAGVEVTDNEPAVFSMRTGDADEVLAGLTAGVAREDGGQCCACDCSAEPAGAAWTTDAWVPWFPVIDRDRCTDCKLCLSFCLFDVYGVDDEGHIAVVHPDQCKTSCPACARVCPNVAIMFPKHATSPINGDEVREADVEREALRADPATLTNTHVYAALRARRSEGGRRFAPADEPIQAADPKPAAGATGMALPALPTQPCACRCSGGGKPAPAPEDAASPAKDQEPSPTDDAWDI